MVSQINYYQQHISPPTTANFSLDRYTTANKAKIPGKLPKSPLKSGTVPILILLKCGIQVGFARIREACTSLPAVVGLPGASSRHHPGIILKSQ